jgi:hypothetical protein
MKYVCLRGNVPSNFEEIFYESIQKGDNSTMKHALTVMFEEHDKELVDKKAMEIAKKLLNEGMKTDKVAEITGLMIDDVLRLQS